MKKLILIGALFFVLGKTGAQSFKANQVHISFDTSFDERTIVWTTPREVNTSFFLVYKSVHGGAYEQIARVQARGASWHTSQYLFTDAEGCGEAAYRVDLVTMDGLITSSLPLKFYEMKYDTLQKNQIAYKCQLVK